MRPKASPPPPARVAIVVPCFNDGATLGETIASIRDDPTHAELVVVDDGSTEAATLSLLDRLEHEGVRVIHQRNQGPSAATMAGLHATSAPYVMRLDADDLLELGAVTALADALDGAPDAAAAWGDFQTFGITTFRVPTVPALDGWLLTYVNCVPGAGCLLRRSALSASGGWQLRNGFEDWDVWLSLAELGYSGIHLPRVMFRYRRDEGGRQAASVTRTDEFYDELRRRHRTLFDTRRDSRRRSTAPAALKVLVTATDSLPFVPRLAKIQLCELYTHLVWYGGVRMTATMMRQAIAVRAGRLPGSWVGRGEARES